LKLLIASDIHGSAYCCRLLLDAYLREKADRLLLLGDILYHGPRNDLPDEYDPKSVISMLNACRQSVISVRGNCEAEVDSIVLAFPCMADYMLIPIGCRTIFATHGHLYSTEHLPPLKDGDIFLQGHTHVPLCEYHSGILCLNPGSVSIPKNNTARSYMTFDGAEFLWKTLSGEVFLKYRLEN